MKRNKNSNKENSNVIDFFTWRSSHDISKLSKEDESILNEKGKYLGVLIKRDAEKIRNITDSLNLKKEQIDYLMFEWEGLQQQYTAMLSNALSFLGRDNPEA